jgi:quinolinate synthase
MPVLNEFYSAESLFEKLGKIHVDHPACTYTKERCARLAPLINEILELKTKKKALILAHSYVHPDIIYGVADHVGDSFGLAKIAKETSADMIIFPSVRFMAETAKLLNPEKVVIDPNPNGRCSLADSISAKEMEKLRHQYPQHTFVCYINTTAEVKAFCDVCVTSSNVYRIITALPSNKIYFLPDRLMGENIRNYVKENRIDKEILFYSGTCYVHEEFSVEYLHFIRNSNPEVKVLAHPECKPEVVQEADVVSSTTGMLEYVKKQEKTNHPFLMLTECGISSRLQVEAPHIKLLGTCMMCKFMRSNSLEMIKQALENPLSSQIVRIDEQIAKHALLSLEKMFFYSDFEPHLV